jgi:hypothetical protein
VLYLNGLRANLETVAILALPHAEGQDVASTDGLKRAYMRLLREVQPTVPRSAGIEIEYVRSGEKLRQLVEVFNRESFLDDTPYELATGGTRDDLFDRLDDCLAEFASADPELRLLFELAVTSVFVARCGTAGGGTTSGAAGVLWLDPRDSWGQRDWLEFLIHELTHLLLFVDEWRYTHYASRKVIVSRDTFARSAIRGIYRPLDKVFHSIVVATEVLLARDAWLGHEGDFVLHPPTPELRESVLESIASVRDVTDYQDRFSPHAIELMDRCKGRLDSLYAGFATTASTTV